MKASEEAKRFRNGEGTVAVFSQVFPNISTVEPKKHRECKGGERFATRQLIEYGKFATLRPVVEKE